MKDKPSRVLIRRYFTKEQGLFLANRYSQMKSRIDNQDKPTYFGKEIMSRSEFYAYTLMNARFFPIFRDWIAGGKQQYMVPSVDRLDRSKGYTADNIEWVTLKENRRRYNWEPEVREYRKNRMRTKNINGWD